MPTIKELQLPKPSNWQDFETIVADAYTQRWKGSAMQKNGRSGQKQNGVDIYGHDEIGRPVGIQCKRFKAALDLAAIEVEVAAAELFEGNLTTLYIATTFDYDAPLQARVRALSDKRVVAGKFAVALIFWEDVVGGLCLNPAVFKAHYPQVTLSPTGTAPDRERLLAALEAGYYGADLWSYVVLLFGEIGQISNADPDEIFATLPVIARRVKQLFSPADAAPILESLDGIRAGCEAPKKRKTDWDPVEDYAKRVQSRLSRSSSLLVLAEGNMLDLGLHLGRLYHHMDDAPSKEDQITLELRVSKMLPASSAAAVESVFKDALKIASGSRWVMRIYGFLNKELRYGD